MVVDEYVMGFAFNPLKDQVLMIEKKHPDWMRGKFNGVGGKIKKNENEYNAMVREFREETGLKTKVKDWTFVATLTEPREKYRVYIFKTELSLQQFQAAKTVTDEDIVRVSLSDLVFLPTLKGTKWLVYLCLDCSVFLPINVYTLDDLDEP